MSLKIVHFSATPLAGAPIRIVRALQKHTPFDVHLVDKKRWGVFDHDLVHEEDPERTVALCEQADVIHLFNYLDYDSKDFAPLDFHALRRKRKRFVRHFESTPNRVGAEMGQRVQDVLACPIPKLVIAQYPERFFPAARVVPNIVPQDDAAYQPCEEPPARDIVFSPSWGRGAWDHRWDTKGMPETVALMRRVAERTGCRIRCMQQKSHAEVMREKRGSALMIDELVTGSYHLSGLEGLSLGRPTLAYLDSRTERVLRVISGSLDCPFVNTRLEEAEEVLLCLLRHPEELKEIGRASRAWMDRYWQDRHLVRHFADVYSLLMEDPTKVTRQEDLRVDTPRTKFLSVHLPDAVHAARARSAGESPPTLPSRQTLPRLPRWALPAVGLGKRMVPPTMREPVRRLVRRLGATAAAWNK